MTYLQAAILGVVQGVAEFLPISSSGHLTLFQHFFGMEEPDSLYNILLHFATLIAVCIYYWKDIWEMILEFFRGIASLGAPKGRHEAVPPARRLVMLVIVGTLPLFLVLPIQDKVEALGANPTVVSCILLVTGLILFAADRIARGGKDASNATWMDALLVGVAQGLATLPGLSRSGSTIAAGMALGFDRKFAVRYSFLLSLPAVLGATLLKVLQVLGEGIDTTLLPMYLAGMALSGVVGYFSIKLVNLLADQKKFGAFAYYCWAAGILCLLNLHVF
ncbi:MAG: undecaprenyl-diphosphate phosphatase [Oscillospiraceae bacterium]|nr:undecaprenyl-diphosphate phosphatase [Oscillospiraceae bacterium]